MRHDTSRHVTLPTNLSGNTTIWEPRGTSLPIIGNLIYIDTKNWLYWTCLNQNQIRISTYILYFSREVHQVHDIIMLKNQVFLTYFYQNHGSISTDILYFLEIIPQTYDIIMPKKLGIFNVFVLKSNQ